MIDLTGIALRFEAVRGILDERSRRLVAAAESAAIGRGGASAVCRATGMSRQVIRQGMAELRQAGIHPPGRVRRPGGGRKKTVAQDPSLVRDLEGLVEPVTRGDPESPLRGTCKSLRKLAQELRQMGHQTSHQLVGRMLHDLDTVCKPTAKRWRERTTRIAMPSLSTSMVKSNANSSGIHPSFRWTPKRKSWWEISRTMGGNCACGAIRRRCACRTSSFRSGGEPIPTGSTISPATQVG